MLRLAISGAITPIVTPFDGRGAVDEAAFRRLVDWQVSAGVRGILVGAVEGEGSSLFDHERIKLVELAQSECGSAVHVMGAVLANGTAEACRQAGLLKQVGVAAIVLACPFYNKPSISGVVAHVTAVAKVGVPLIIANVPSRSAIDIATSHVEQIAAVNGVIGLLDGTRDLTRPMATQSLVPRGFVQLCGVDEVMVAFNLSGGRGSIAAISNLAPKTSSWLQEACLAQDWSSAQRLQNELSATIEALPPFGIAAALKERLHVAGRLVSRVARLPEVSVSG